MANDRLTDKQQLFAQMYVKHFNATKAAIQAGYSEKGASIRGHELLRNIKVKEEVDRLKKHKIETLNNINKEDVIQQYINIAFADIGDYIEVKKIKKKTRNGEEYTDTVVILKDMDTVDTSIISELTTGKDGNKVKLHDKMKALEKIEQFLEVMPDKKAEIMREKLELEKKRITGDIDINEDDGLLSAITNNKDDWDEDIQSK